MIKKNPSFKRIALMGRHDRDPIQETLIALHEFLTLRNCPVVYDHETASRLPFKINSVSIEMLAQHCDLLIVVGGDGSLLQAAKIAVAQSLPVLGVNRGRLGFLTDIYPHELATIEAVLNGEYQAENRFLLQCHVYREDHVIASIDAVNEIVLSPDSIAHMIEFEVMVNKRFVCDLRADGLIIATPTGSTAYALSGGGPIVEPSLNAIVLVPMFPHTLTNRPLVIDANAHLTIHITSHNDIIPFISGDGQKCMSIERSDRLILQKHASPLKLIHPQTYDYFETLRSKLNWQSRHKNC